MKPTIRYWISVTIFLAGTVLSLVLAIREDDIKLIGITVAMFGFLAFMVVDRIEMTGVIDNLVERIKGMRKPIDQLQADVIRRRASETGKGCRRLGSSESFDYVCNKIRSARTMYNTSFSTDKARSSGAFYSKWINAMVDAVTDNNCIIQEVMASENRFNEIRRVFKGRRKRLQGSYTASFFDPSNSTLTSIPFVEFSVFEDIDGSREVIFGWSNSNNEFISGDCFILDDPSAVNYFITYFNRIKLHCVEANSLT